MAGQAEAVGVGIEHLTEADLEKHNPALVARIRRRAIEEQSATAHAIAQMIHATQLPDHIQGSLQALCLGKSIPDAKGLIDRAEAVEAAVASGMMALKANARMDAEELGKYEAAMRESCDGLPRAAAVLNVQSIVDKRLGINKALVADKDQAVAGQDPEKPKVREDLKVEVDRAKAGYAKLVKAHGGRVDHTEKEFVLADLAERKVAHTVDEVKTIDPKIFEDHEKAQAAAQDQK